MTVLIPGTRDVRATLDQPETAAKRRLVVACPPHPQMGGDRHDGRLRAVSDALTARGIDCLRIDYGAWDEGNGEQTDVKHAVEWATDRADDVGLFGYSFGATVALLASEAPTPDALSLLAPGETVIDGAKPSERLTQLTCPVQLLYGERDTVVESEPLVKSAKQRGFEVGAIAGDHFFLGQQAKIAERVGSFVEDSLASR